MGIHIIPYLLGENKIEKTSFYEERYIEKERYDSFDSIRMAGDTDFIFESKFEWEYKHEDPQNPDFEYRRPKDINLAKIWVKNNIPKNNQNRLMNLLKDMEKKENLWISVSY